MCEFVEYEADQLLTFIKGKWREIFRFTTRWKQSNFEYTFQSHELLPQEISSKGPKKPFAVILIDEKTAFLEMLSKIACVLQMVVF